MSFRKLRHRHWAWVVIGIFVISGVGVLGPWRTLAAPRPREVITASGTIEAEEIRISSETGGRIVQVAVDEGDAVKAGQLLVQLDDSLWIAQVSEAEAALAAARAALAEVKAGPRPSEIAAARAEVARAEAELAGARAAYQHAQALLKTPHDLNAQIDDAQARIAQAQAQIGQAQARYGAAQALRDATTGGTDYDKTKRKVYELQMAAAQAAIEAAQEAQKGAEAILAALQEVRQNPLSLIAEVHRAEGQVKVAEANLALAQAKLEALLAGPQPEKVRAAEAEVQQAEATLRLVQVQRERLALRSPITGLVTSRLVDPGELAAPGAVLMTVADLDQVTLRIFVPTDRIGYVHLGQKAIVTVNSFRDRKFEGRVVYIADRAEFTPRNVQTQEERVQTVFAVKLQLDNPEHLLKPGMPADATLVD
ncbi:MAG: efflux RND transporter periplasmic adaptor subunit [Anaerolineae bacterium]|nr:efflux RND transporter periplasmic adaptor subunit [Anaerolineae bacterium]MDW8100233.1 efflux RND transporter periplasmic adaptor subunit [Anaerolineae bacterium]